MEGDLDRMRIIRLPRCACLGAVFGLGEIIGPHDLPRFDAGIISLDLLDEFGLSYHKGIVAYKKIKNLKKPGFNPGFSNNKIKKSPLLSRVRLTGRLLCGSARTGIHAASSGSATARAHAGRARSGRSHAAGCRARTVSAG